tara:strand:+ start:7847 stop:8143 length:297 start_codon:yes stop_codon:yes gene_type:complete
MESPSHYTRGSVEVWDFIRDQQLNYHLGNAIKYICRAGFKSNNTKTEDLKKAIHYLKNELEHTTLQSSISFGPSDLLSFSVWDPEQSGEPDYATGFDR